MFQDALRAVPATITGRIGLCRVETVPDPGFGSSWRRTTDSLEITVATEDVEEHEVAMEVLLCVGQALWETTTPAEREAWLRVVIDEIDAGVEGEIDEDALREKHAGASFASTVAEYVHSLWHDVTVREGPERLPARWVRQRFGLMKRWFGP
jgi:hypothetical protein